MELASIKSVVLKHVCFKYFLGFCYYITETKILDTRNDELFFQYNPWPVKFLPMTRAQCSPRLSNSRPLVNPAPGTAQRGGWGTLGSLCHSVVPPDPPPNPSWCPSHRHSDAMTPESQPVQSPMAQRRDEKAALPVLLMRGPTSCPSAAGFTPLPPLLGHPFHWKPLLTSLVTCRHGVNSCFTSHLRGAVIAHLTTPNRHLKGSILCY